MEAVEYETSETMNHVGVCCLSFITHGMEVSELFTVDVVVQYDLL